MGIFVYGIPYTGNPIVGAMLRKGFYNVFRTILETSHAGKPKPGRLYLLTQPYTDLTNAFG